MRYPPTLRYRTVCAFVLCAAGALAQGVPVPYTESFESPTWPGPEWVITLSAPAFGRIQAVVPSPVSPDGGKAANFDVTTSPNVSTNELTLAVDLAASPGALLKYWAKETGDETDVQDGLFLNDGISATWFKVVDHATLTASWVEITVDLVAEALANGLTVTSNFNVRFSQRDNFPTPTDGLQIDGVRLIAPSTGQPNSALALFDVNGDSGVISVPGPFLITAASGSLMTFTIQGMPNQPYLLIAGPLHTNHLLFPGIGSFDLGNALDLSDIQVVLDGTAPGFLNSLARTGPTGSSVLSFTLPFAPPGEWLAFQAAVFNGPAVLTLSAANQISVP